LVTLGNSLKLEKAHNSASNLHADGADDDAEFNKIIDDFIKELVDDANSYESDEAFTQ